MTKQSSGENVVFSTQWFEVVAKSTGPGDPYFSIRTVDYVSIVAVTGRNQLLLVRQFRPALGVTTLELPSGRVDAGETPEQSARRELLEETGYQAGKMDLLGAFCPDTGRFENRGWFYFTNQIEPQAGHQSEAGVELVLYERTAADLMAEKTFLNSMHATALFLAILKKHLPAAA